MATLRFNTDMKDFGKFHTKLAKLRLTAVKPAIDKAARDLLSSLRARTMVARKVDTAALRSGWRAKTTRTSAVFSNVAKHHAFVELGRKPGGRMPPVKAIEAWAARRLGKRGLGWVIARKIARRGIRPTPLLTSAAFKAKVKELMRRELQAALRLSARQAAR